VIAILKGKLEEKQTTGIVLDVNGVGYELAVPMSTFCNLPDAGREVRLYVQMVVREDAILLYGFLTREEKSAFQALVKAPRPRSLSSLGCLCRIWPLPFRMSRVISSRVFRVSERRPRQGSSSS
jgi:Holliday junction DNA helicase RuvA